MKIVIVLALIGILVALTLAGRAMLRHGGDGDNAASRSSRMVNALTWRIGLSVALFLFVLLSWKLGWIHPNNVQFNR